MTIEGHTNLYTLKGHDIVVEVKAHTSLTTQRDRMNLLLDCTDKPIERVRWVDRLIASS